MQITNGDWYGYVRRVHVLPGWEYNSAVGARERGRASPEAHPAANY